MANQLYTEDGEELYNSKGELLFDNDSEAIETKPKAEYQYENRDQYEDLKRNLSEVGYDGLDDSQKKLFQDQFNNSKFAQAGGSFEDAVKYVNESAGVNEANKNAGDAYTLGRDILTTGLSPYTAGLEYLKDRALDEGSWADGDGDSYAEYINKHMEAGNKGEGVVGFVGNPTNVMGGSSSLLKGLPYVGSPMARGAIEGVGLSALDQYNTEGKIDKNALALSGLAGGIIGSGSDKIKTEADKYRTFLKNKEAYENDPFEFIASSPEADKAVAKNLSDRARDLDKIDPNNLLGDYTFTDMKNPAQVKDLMKKVKEDIAKRSLVPRKMSSITDREAREHLENISKTANKTNPDIFVDVVPKDPLGNVKIPLGSMALGGFAGHYAAGVPGAIIGTTLGTPVAKDALERIVTKGVNTGAKIAVSPVGGALGAIPYSPLTTGIIDRIVNLKEKRE